MKTSTKAWNYIRNILGAVGLFFIIGGVGTSDYYALELGTTEPTGLWLKIVLGLVLVTPSIIHIIKENYEL